MKNKITFNNGFVTAIGLFLAHEWQFSDEPTRKITKSDMRLYGATDHLYDIEIPETLSTKLKKKIITWHINCFHYRLRYIDRIKGQKFFDEAKEILKLIDEEIFKTKKVIINHG